MDKKSFLFYMNWEEQVDLMNNTELRRFVKNLFRYHKGEDVELPTKIEKLTWLGIVKALETNNTKYEKKIEANRENGKLGGAPKGNQNASKSKTTQNNPNNPIIDKRKMIKEKSELKNENNEEIKDNWQQKRVKSQQEKVNWEKTNVERKDIKEDSRTSNTIEYSGVYTGTYILGHEIDEINHIMNTTYADAQYNLKDSLFRGLIVDKLEEKIIATGLFKNNVFQVLKEKDLHHLKTRLPKEDYDSVEPLLLEYINLISI